MNALGNASQALLELLHAACSLTTDGTRAGNDKPPCSNTKALCSPAEAHANPSAGPGAFHASTSSGHLQDEANDGTMPSGHLPHVSSSDIRPLVPHEIAAIHSSASVGTIEVSLSCPDSFPEAASFHPVNVISHAGPDAGRASSNRDVMLKETTAFVQDTLHAVNRPSSLAAFGSQSCQQPLEAKASHLWQSLSTNLKEPRWSGLGSRAHQDSLETVTCSREHPHLMLSKDCRQHAGSALDLVGGAAMVEERPAAAAPRPAGGFCPANSHQLLQVGPSRSPSLLLTGTIPRYDGSTPLPITHSHPAACWPNAEQPGSQRPNSHMWMEQTEHDPGVPSQILVDSASQNHASLSRPGLTGTDQVPDPYERSQQQHSLHRIEQSQAPLPYGLLDQFGPSPGLQQQLSTMPRLHEGTESAPAWLRHQRPLQQLPCLHSQPQQSWSVSLHLPGCNSMVHPQLCDKMPAVGPLWSPINGRCMDVSGLDAMQIDSAPNNSSSAKSAQEGPVAASFSAQLSDGTCRTDSSDQALLEAHLHAFQRPNAYKQPAQMPSGDGGQFCPDAGQIASAVAPRVLSQMSLNWLLDADLNDEEVKAYLMKIAGDRLASLCSIAYQAKRPDECCKILVHKLVWSSHKASCGRLDCT